MSTPHELRMQRLERTVSAGMVRFVLTRGLAFAVLFGVLAYIIAPPPIPWFASAPLFCLMGFAWAAGMWFVILWSYKRAKKSRG